MNKEEELLAKRIQDLARIADARGQASFTEFLNLNEQNILHQTLQKVSFVHGETFGGYEGAERQIAALIPDAFSYGEIVYPVTCIRIAPVNMKFAEQLSHRDILGALMHLGIERSRLGDIARMEGQFYLFCHTDLAPLICGELTRVRHTTVSCELCSLEHFSYTPEVKEIRGSVASVRLDAVMAVAFQSSRSSLLELIGDGKVFINGRLIATNAYTLREGDLVSVRGMGKFRYTGTTGQTKKGRTMVIVEKYI